MKKFKVLKISSNAVEIFKCVRFFKRKSILFLVCTVYYFWSEKNEKQFKNFDTVVNLCHT